MFTFTRVKAPDVVTDYVAFAEAHLAGVFDRAKWILPSQKPSSGERPRDGQSLQKGVRHAGGEEEEDG